MPEAASPAMSGTVRHMSSFLVIVRRPGHYGLMVAT